MPIEIFMNGEQKATLGPVAGEITLHDPLVRISWSGDSVGITNIRPGADIRGFSRNLEKEGSITTGEILEYIDGANKFFGIPENIDVSVKNELEIRRIK